MSRAALFSKPYADRVAKLRVPGGFLLVAAFVLLARPTVESLWRGLPIAVAGMALRAWAAGHLAKNEALAQGGPYRYVRNPLYLGTLLVAAGLVIGARQWALALLFASVFVGVYLPVIELEEQHLRSLFPQYRDYAARVPLLLPTAAPLPPQGAFRPALYRRNQEYQALGGFLLGVAFLAWRAL